MNHLPLTSRIIPVCPLGDQALAMTHLPKPNPLSLGPGYQCPPLSTVISGNINERELAFFTKSTRRELGAYLAMTWGKLTVSAVSEHPSLGKTIQVISFLSAIMRKTGTIEDHGRRKRLIRASQEGRLNPKHWPTALIVCPKSLISNVSVQYYRMR